MPHDAILFDLDGCLVDSRAAIVRCMNAALAEHGHAERAPQDMLWCIGPPLKETFRRLTGEPEVEHYIHAYRSRYRTQMTVDTFARPLRALPRGARPVMVGDREHDVHGAAVHGLDCIGVLWGFGSREELLGAGAAAVAETPAELAELLR